MPRRDSNYVRALKGRKPRIPPGEQIIFPVEQAVACTPPDYLTPEALVHWRRMVVILDAIKLFQAPTRDKLARYCQACADYENIQEGRKKLGSSRNKWTPRLDRQISYWMRMMAMAEKTMESFEGEYGLTPASAAKVRHPNGDKNNPMKKILDFIDNKPKPMNDLDEEI